LRAVAEAGVRRVVLTSSSVVFGHSEAPTILDESRPLAVSDDDNAYVVAKIRQDELTMALGTNLGLEVVSVCPTLSVGPHGSRLGPSNGLILGYLSDPYKATFPGGCNLVSTVDVARGHWLAAQSGTAGSRYILGSENLSWAAVHGLIAELAGVAPPRMKLGHGLSFLAAAASVSAQ